MEIHDWDGNVYRPLEGVSSLRYFVKDTTFAPRESITRYMLFEIPDNLINGNQPIGIEFLIKQQKAVFILD